jgi:hypothetical protein
VGSLAGAAHLLKDNAGVLRGTHVVGAWPFGFGRSRFGPFAVLAVCVSGLFVAPGTSSVGYASVGRNGGADSDGQGGLLCRFSRALLLGRGFDFGGSNE